MSALEEKNTQQAPLFTCSKLVGLLKTRFDHYINFTAKGWANLLVILVIIEELIKAQSER